MTMARMLYPTSKTAPAQTRQPRPLQSLYTPCADCGAMVERRKHMSDRWLTRHKAYCQNCLIDQRQIEQARFVCPLCLAPLAACDCATRYTPEQLDRNYAAMSFQFEAMNGKYRRSK